MTNDNQKTPEWNNAEELQKALAKLDEHTSDAILAYISRGQDPGGFLTSVFSNDFYHAISRASPENREPTKIMAFRDVLSTAPALCWGSQHRVANWLKFKGLIGVSVMADKQREFAIHTLQSS